MQNLNEKVLFVKILHILRNFKMFVLNEFLSKWLRSWCVWKLMIFILHFCILRASMNTLRASTSIHKYIQNRYYILWNYTRKCSQMIEDARNMFVRCKFEKFRLRAFKRTNSEVFWIKSRWERSIWNLLNFANFGSVLVGFRYSPLNCLFFVNRKKKMIIIWL